MKRPTHTSDLLRQGLRLHIESNYPIHPPTKAEEAAVCQGRIAFKNGEYITLDRLHDEIDHPTSSRQLEAESPCGFERGNDPSGRALLSRRLRRAVLPLGLLAALYRDHRPAKAKPDDFVFQQDGEPLDDRSILRSVIRPAAKRLGFYFEGFGWHSFRRQNITVIQEEGATAFEAMAQAGHSRPTMTGEYTIVGFTRREQAVKRLQERLLLGRQQASAEVN